MFASQRGASNKQIRCLELFTLGEGMFAAAADEKGSLAILSKTGGVLNVVRSVIVDASCITALRYQGNSFLSPEPVLLVGCRNGRITVFDAGSLVSNEVEPKVVTVVNDTSSCVCCISACSDGGFIADSWDCVTRVRTQEKLVELRQGSFAAWCTIEAGGHLYSGCADGSLKRWSRDGKLIDRIDKLHEEAIRDMVLRNGTIVIASNDGCISVVSLEMKKLACIKVNGGFLYKLALSGNLAVTGGEDELIHVVDLDRRTVIDVIGIGSPIWAVAAEQNGDVVVGCGDGSVRAFTMHSELKASDDQQEMYTYMLASRVIDPRQLEGVRPDMLPTKPDPAFSMGKMHLVRDSAGVVLMFPSKGYKGWLKFGTCRMTKRRTDPTGREYDNTVTIEFNDQRCSLYVDFSETIDQNVDHFVKHGPLRNLTPGDRKQIHDFLAENLKGRFASK